MTTAKSIEYQITQQLLRRRAGVNEQVNTQVVNRIIRIAAATVAVGLMGSYLQELLWVVVAASTVLVLGLKN
jgi:ABC-type bacteriocin/lantibiotic exporter with double-glycine peptidase domain